MSIHRPINVEIHREKNQVVLVIVGSGSLTMPKEAAHTMARELMRVVGEIEFIEKRNGGAFQI